MKKIIIAGLGPGSPEDMTPAVLHAVSQADAVVGYKYYFQFVEPYLKERCECVDTGMKKERERAEMAFQLALQEKTVVVISSGDAGIYGMAPLIYEMQQEQAAADVEVTVLPGISAFQKAASLLGAPIGHDMCIISLSDLMTPWSLIERRIRAAAVGDFVTAVYNPKSHGRYWQLYRLQELFLQERSADTPVGYVRQAGRDDQLVKLTTLGAFDPEEVDMFTVVLIGNSQSYIADGKFITPRGYYRQESSSSESVGKSIMQQSFRTILSEMQHPDVPRWRLWPLLHAIHTTVDFSMEDCLWMDERATELIYNKVKDGTLKHIVTDVTMAASGIRKGALDRLGIQVHCYINDAKTKQMAEEKGITRSQASMQQAAEQYPDALYVVGNAPTALFEICDLVHKGKLHPAGIIAAPVGFVHVCESKHAVKTLRHIPKLIVEGRKGGSNLAATLCNAILTFDDAEFLSPGRDI
ncbi:MAG: precorrin-3B C(17)-methyltransferase [Prevotella sp.]|nr:precorrin-3B C(17)-methyltransferase [Prevotella sp.]